MRTTTLSAIALLMVSGVAQVLAQNSLGSASATEIRIPTDIRASAMGGAAVALQDGGDDLTNNPAGLGQLQGAAFTFSSSFWVTGIALEHLVFGTEAGNVGFALSADYLNFGQIGLFTAAGTPNGSVSPQSFDFSGGLGVNLSNGFYMGGAARWFGEDLTNTSLNSTVLGNFGLLYSSKIGLSAGVALINVGPGLYGFEAPTQISGGASYRVGVGSPSESLRAETHVFTVAVEGDEFPYTQETSLSVGGEYYYNHTIAVRAGYRFAPYGNVNEIAGLSIGGGLHLYQFELSYALITMGALGNSNQLSLSMHL